jgi:hypothetical protein
MKTIKQSADDNTIAGHIENSISSVPRYFDFGGFKLPMTFAATAGGGAAAVLLNKLFDSKLKRLQKADKKELNRIRKHFKLKDLPVLPYKGLRNAAYVDSGKFHPGIFQEPLHHSDSTLSAAVSRQPEIEEKLKQHGVILYDDRLNTPAILAHEAGHADIGNKPWYSPSKLNQNYGRTLASVANFAAPLAGLFTGAMTRNPFLGIGAGALTGAALNAPTLINEWQATNRANKYLDTKRMSSDEKKKSRKTLGSAYNTYLSHAAVPAAIMGGLGGYFARNAGKTACARDLFRIAKKQQSLTGQTK